MLSTQKQTVNVKLQSHRASSFRSANLVQYAPSTGKESLATVAFFILQVKNAQLIVCLLESLLNTVLKSLYCSKYFVHIWHSNIVGHKENSICKKTLSACRCQCRYVLVYICRSERMMCPWNSLACVELVWHRQSSSPLCWTHRLLCANEWVCELHASSISCFAS